MKRKFFISFAVAFSALFIVVGILFAGTYRSPSKDTSCYVNYGNQCYDNYGIQAEASDNGTGQCVPTVVGYVGWDLSSESRSWSSAALTLTAYSVTGGTPPFTFALFSPSDHDWTEDGVAPGYVGSAIVTTTVSSLSAGESVVFTSDDLGSHFSALKGHNASLAVVLTDGCGSHSANIAFEDLEGSGGLHAPTSVKEADLVFWTGAVDPNTNDPTAVDVASVKANTDSPSSNWPVIVGLVALFALVVAGVGFGVRRSNS